MADSSWQADVAVIGAGPAGCSAALWLSEMGFSAVLLEKSSHLLARLTGLQLPQNWVLGAPQALVSDLAQHYASHIRMQPEVRIVLDDAVAHARRSMPAGWRLVTQAGRIIETRAVVVATGLQPRRFAACAGPETPLDARELTRQRARLPVGRFLLLGGGDNAVENAAYLTRAGHAVTLWSRGPLRAQRHLLARLEGLPAEGLTLRAGQPMPARLVSLPRESGSADTWQVDSAAFGVESFDHVAALFGYAPDETVLRLLAKATGSIGALPGAGIVVAGDLSGRWHPCIASAVADGVEAAKQVQDWLDRDASGLTHPDALTDAPALDMGQRRLSFTGLRFKAALGILEHERAAPQPIQVDAELNLGQQSMDVRDDAITHVLDYRKVRQIIIDECTAKHVNLLETLVGKLCARLLQLPGVLGVRIKITKLEIFDDCEVAIRMEAGTW
jgi:dihydroneopterin aldolase